HPPPSPAPTVHLLPPPLPDHTRPVPHGLPSPGSSTPAGSPAAGPSSPLPAPLAAHLRPAAAAPARHTIRCRRSPATLLRARPTPSAASLPHPIFPRLRTARSPSAPVATPRSSPCSGSHRS